MAQVILSPSRGHVKRSPFAHSFRRHHITYAYSRAAAVEERFPLKSHRLAAGDTTSRVTGWRWEAAHLESQVGAEGYCVWSHRLALRDLKSRVTGWR